MERYMTPYTVKEAKAFKRQDVTGMWGTHIWSRLLEKAGAKH